VRRWNNKTSVGYFHFTRTQTMQPRSVYIAYLPLILCDAATRRRVRSIAVVVVGVVAVATTSSTCRRPAGPHRTTYIRAGAVVRMSRLAVL